MHDKLTPEKLSPDQRVAYDGIMTWLNRATATKRTLTLGGFAGSGKSTVVSVVAHELLKLGPIAFCAFTGKASSVLARKLAAAGIPTVNRIVRRDLLGGVGAFEPRPYCGTIHGLVYRPCDECMTETKYEHTMGPECREPRPARDEDAPTGGEDAPAGDELGDALKKALATPSRPATVCFGCDPPPPVKRDGPCQRCSNARYLRRETLDRSYRLIVVDEASMVSDEILDTLLQFRVPILAVGDHGQLPPVKGAGSLMRAPDLRLEKIHRQAAGNPIIALSARIRETGTIDDALEDGHAFSILAKRDMPKWIAQRFTQSRLAADPATPAGIMGTVMISWTNKTRVSLNYDIREALGDSGPPRAGEVMICLKNKAPIYNGMRGVLAGNAERWGAPGEKAPKWRVSVNFVEDGQKAENILVSELQFFAEKTIDYDAAQELGVSMSKLGELYDFGYAMTCHKLQGSQAPEVGVLLEPGLTRMPREDRTRWLYTAATRAAERLTIIR